MPTANIQFRKPVEAEPGSVNSVSRSDFIEMVHTMTASIRYPLVLAIDGVWGTGKTHLLKTWEIQLNEEARPYVYFNAWEHDHSEDPFISFMGVVRQALLRYEDDGGKIAAFVEKAVKAVPGIINIGGRVLANAACRQVGIPPDILDGKALYDAAQRQIESYQESHDSIDTFRKELEGTAESIGNLWVLKRPKTDPTQPAPERPPLLVLVDELDRCRPDFAVKLLERVKHLFNVPGVVFVFVVDMGQLQESTRTLYGQGMNSDGYFRRFFDLVIPLPELERPQRLKFCTTLLVGLGTAEVANAGANSDVSQLAEFLHWLGFVFNFSLRELNHVGALSDLFLRSNRGARESWEFSFFSVALRMKRNDLFIKAKMRTLMPSDISGLLPVADSMNLSSESGFYDLQGAVAILLNGLYGTDEEFWGKLDGYMQTLPEKQLGRILLEGVSKRQRRVDGRYQSWVVGTMNSLALLVSAQPSRGGAVLPD